MSTARVDFTRGAAERIARVVRLVEQGDRGQSGPTWERVPGGGGGGIEMGGNVLLPRGKVITTHRELLTKLPLPTAAALMWTMHYHSFVLPAATDAAPAMRCCSRRGQSPDNPRDPPTTSSCAASPPPSFAAPAASHPLDPCCRDIDNSALVFVVVVGGEGGGRRPVVRGPYRFGGRRRWGLERILSTSCPL